MQIHHGLIKYGRIKVKEEQQKAILIWRNEMIMCGFCKNLYYDEYNYYYCSLDRETTDSEDCDKFKERTYEIQLRTN